MSEKSVKRILFSSIVSGFAGSFFKKRLSGEPRYAGHMLRFMSLMIDFFIIGFLISALDKLIWEIIPFCKPIDAGILIQKHRFGETTLAEQSAITQLIKCTIFTRISVFSFILSSIICLWMFKGVTPAAWLFRIRIIDAKTGQSKMSFKKAILRFFAAFVSALPLCLGYLWIMFDKRGRAWHDVWCKTYVVHYSDTYKE